jgi:drug/metabolite transporter (DMT)-like permease
MIWLVLCTLSSTAIFVIFKLLEKTPLINAIIVNYIIASVFVFFLYGSFPVADVFKADWLFISIIIGFLFIVMFFIIGLSSQLVGISITTVAGKMSVIIPMIFAIIAFDENLGVIKVVGILTAITAVAMSVYKSNKTKEKVKIAYLMLPIVLFVGMGIVDSSVIYSKEAYVDDSVAALFSATVFSFALLTGFIYSLVNRKIFANFFIPRVWYLGAALGIVNFGSIYLMIRALNSGVFHNSVVFGINNIGIVGLSVLIGTFVFGEKLTIINKIGILLSIFAIGLLTIADSNING